MERCTRLIYTDFCTETVQYTVCEVAQNSTGTTCYCLNQLLTVAQVDIVRQHRSYGMTCLIGRCAAAAAAITDQACN